MDESSKKVSEYKQVIIEKRKAEFQAAKRSRKAQARKEKLA